MEKLALLASIGVADVIGTAAAADDQGNAILKEVATLLFVFTGKKKYEVQILRPPKPGSLLVIVLSFPLIGFLSGS